MAAPAVGRPPQITIPDAPQRAPRSALLESNRLPPHAAKAYPFKIGKHIFGSLGVADGTVVIKLLNQYGVSPVLSMTISLSQQLPQKVILNVNSFSGFELPKDIPISTPDDALYGTLLYLLTTRFDPAEPLPLSGKQIRDLIKSAIDAINEAVLARLKEIDNEFVQAEGTRRSGGEAGLKAPTTNWDWEKGLNNEKWNLTRGSQMIHAFFGEDVAKEERARILSFSVAAKELKAASR